MILDTTLIPPHSIEAEQSVLGAILLEGSTALDRIEGEITASDFYRQEHQLIFKSARKLSNAGSPIDVITIAEALDGSDSLDRIGGLAYLGNLAQNVPGAANIRFYAKTVRERSLQRRLRALAVEIQDECNLPCADIAGIICKADSAMVQLLDTNQDDPAMLSDVMAEAIDEMDDRATGCRPSGLLTGVQDFDAITGGLEPGQLVIVAARPSVGKTAFALNVANHITREGRTVAFFSLEMQRCELAQRLIAMRTGVRPPLCAGSPANHSGRGRSLSGTRPRKSVERHVAVLPGAGYRAGAASGRHRRLHVQPWRGSAADINVAATDQPAGLVKRST